MCLWTLIGVIVFIVFNLLEINDSEVEWLVIG